MRLLSHPANIVFLCFCIITVIQLFYYLYFFSRLAFFKNKPRNNTQALPLSVIICARDEAGNLTRFLPGALVQKYPGTHEVIVVNDNSTDESKYILEEFQRTFEHLEIIELTQKAQLISGKKFPLSMGIKSARYETLLLTDADCFPATDRWMQKMMEKYDDGIDIVLGFSPFQKKKGLLNKLVRWEAFLSAVQYFSYACRGLAYMGVGRNLSYKKAIFFENKGFSSFNNLPGGDDDLFINKTATKSNVAISLDPETFTITIPPATWNQWKSQKERHYSTSRYYKPVHKFFLGLYAISSFWYYPLLVCCFFVFDWKIVLAVFGVRFVVQYMILYYCAKKLQQTDLIVWTLFFDIWMFFYYLIFAGSIIKKPKPTWK